MSRCYPFPPPGYEKKIRTDDADLIKKEKQKEKKHKKDKKDKEKRDSKEKREKEGRDKKHKEKDKKEKHREKKKDKDKERDRDKSKTSTADGKGLPGEAEGLGAGKLQKEINHDKGIFVDNKIIKQYNGKNGEIARENNHLVGENKNSKFILELERRIKDDGKAIHTEVRPSGNNTTIQNHGGYFHPKADEMPKVMGKYFDKNSGERVGGKEKVDEKKDEGKEKVMEKKDEGKEKVKEKIKKKKDKDDRRGEKRKNKEEKKGHGKDKDRDKEKKEKTKEHTESIIPEQNKLKESNNGGPIHSNFFTQISKNGHENSVGGKNLNKRKEIESNGVPHDNDNWPSKLPRSSFSYPFTENGRILEPCQISIPNASDRPGVATTTATASAKVENKECKINGFIEAQPLVPSNKTHTATAPTVPSIEASAKPPHPDNKYLSQIYSVPKVELSDVDDEEWLFSSNISQERKDAVKSSEAGETTQVWAEVVHLESADVFALPYVIPY